MNDVNTFLEFREYKEYRDRQNLMQQYDEEVFSAIQADIDKELAKRSSRTISRRRQVSAQRQPNANPSPAHARAAHHTACGRDGCGVPSDAPPPPLFGRPRTTTSYVHRTQSRTASSATSSCPTTSPTRRSSTRSATATARSATRARSSYATRGRAFAPHAPLPRGHA